MVRSSVWLAAISLCREDILLACSTAWAEGVLDGPFMRVGNKAFRQCPADSIDYAVIERLAAGAPGLPPAVVIPVAMGWSDVGAWEALWTILPKDAGGNVVRGDVLLHDCHDTMALSSGRLLVCIGVDDLIVVETPDAILVSRREQAQEVKQVVDQLKREQRSEALIHRRVSRPWGSYDCVDAGQRFLVKRIIVKPGGTLSLQMHHHRAEHWVVVRGTAKVTCGDHAYLLSENESTFIPLGEKHRLENPGRVPLEMIEVQSGSYLGEDDIVRFEDIYRR
jgi:mannose-1-phosphate guanylyltransferase/mannose-6-phosphate isomerase